jgi:hypothetical protein
MMRSDSLTSSLADIPPEREFNLVLMYFGFMKIQASYY